MCEPNASEKEPEEGKMSRTWSARFYCLSNLKYIKVTKNFYSQSLGNLEVIEVQKTACFAHMTSRSYNPKFNNPLEKVVDTLAISHQISLPIQKSQQHIAHCFLLGVCGIFQGKMSVLQLVIREKIHIPVPTDRENFHPPGTGRGKMC